MTTNLAGGAVTETFAVSGNDEYGPYVDIGSGAPGALTLTTAGASVVVTESAYAILETSAPIAVTVDGPGEIVFDGADAYSGGTTITAGVVSILDAGALGTGAVTLLGSPNGATLEFASPMTFANPIETSDEATLAAATGDSVTLTGAVTGNGDVTFGSTTDRGVIDFAPGYSDSVLRSATVAGGLVKIGNASAAIVFGAAEAVAVGVGTTSATLDINGYQTTLKGLSGASSGVVTNNGGAAVLALLGDLEFDGAIEDGSGQISVGVGPGSSLVLAGTLGWSGSTTVQSSATLQIGNGGSAGAVSAFATGALTVGGVLAVDRSDSVTIGGVLSGAGTLRQIGTGSLTLAGDGSRFSGGAEIDSGALVLDSANPLGSGGVTFSGGGGTLTAAISAGLSGKLVVDQGAGATIEAAAGAVLTVGASDFEGNGGAGTTLHFGSAVDTGVIFLAVTGPTHIDDGGALAIDGGLVKIGSNSAANVFGAVGAVAVGVGTTLATLDINGYRTALAGLSGASSGVVTDNGNAAILELAGGLEFDGAIVDGSGRISVDVGSGSSLVLAGTLGWSGSTTVETGATLQIGKGVSAGAVSAFATGALTVDGVLAIDRSDSVTIGAALSGGGALRQIGTGSLTLAGDGSGFSGRAEIDSGALVLDSANPLGSGGVAFAGGGGTLTAAISTGIAGSLIVNAAASATLEAASGAILTVGSADFEDIGGAGSTLHVGSAVDTGEVSLALPGTTKVDDGGALALDGGALVVASAGAAAVIGQLHGGAAIGTTASAATLDIDGQDFGVWNLTGNASGVIADSGAAATLTAYNSVASTFAGVIEGPVSLDVEPWNPTDGVLTLTGANLYTGATTIGGGATLQVGDGGTAGSLSSGGALEIAGALQFDRSDAVTLHAALGGDGVLRQMGSGTLTLAGSGAGFTGTAEIDSGALTLSQFDSLGSGGVAFAGGGGALRATAETTVVGALSLDPGADATFEAAPGAMLMLNSPDIVTAGDMTTTLTFGSATDTGIVAVDLVSATGDAYGEMAVDGGVAFCGGPGASALVAMAGSVAVGAAGTAATLDANMFDLQLHDLTGAAKGVIVNSGGAATIYAVNDKSTRYAGAIEDGAGPLALDVTGAPGAALTLAGASTYSGGTALESETLDVANASALGSGVVTFAAGGNATLELETGDAPANTIAGFALGDAIEFAGLSYAPGDHIAVVGSGATRTVEILDSHGTALASLAFGGAWAASDLALAPVAGGLDIEATATVSQFLAQRATLDTLPNGFFVSDTAANIAAYLTASVAAGPSALALDAARITSITASDGKPVTVGNGVFVADRAALDRIAGGFRISGKASMLNTNLDGLEADQARIDSVTAADAQGQIVGLTATIAQFVADEQILMKSAGGFAISDTAANIAAYLTGAVPTALALDASHITSITASDGNPVTVGGGAFSADLAALDKIVGGFWISGKASVLNGNLAGLEADQAHIVSVTATGGAITATIAQFQADEPILNKVVGGFVVSDTAADIAAALTGTVPTALALDAGHIASITATGGTVAVGDGAFVADRAALDKIAGGFAITGKASVLNGNGVLAGLEADQANIDSVTATGGAITATIAQFGADEPILNKVSGGFVVADTAADISTDLTGTVPTALALDAGHITSITASGGAVAVGDGAFVADEAALDKIAGGFAITGKASVLDGNLDGLENDVGHIVSITGASGVITGTMANFARDEAAMNTIVGGFDISDTAANIAAGLGLLQGDVGHIDAITLTDATKPTITLTATQATADHAVLAKITSPFTLVT